MTYKKFIVKNGKTYGPYVYHSKRVNGKVVSQYFGPKELTTFPLKKLFIYTSLSILALFLLVFALGFFYNNYSIQQSDSNPSSLAEVSAFSSVQENSGIERFFDFTKKIYVSASSSIVKILGLSVDESSESSSSDESSSDSSESASEEISEVVETETSETTEIPSEETTSVIETTETPTETTTETPVEGSESEVETDKEKKEKKDKSEETSNETILDVEENESAIVETNESEENATEIISNSSVVENITIETNVSLEENTTLIENVTIEENETEELNISIETALNFSLIKEIPTIRISKNSYYVLDLSEYFNQAENYSFLAENISSELDGDSLKLTPDENFSGSRNAVLTAFNGNDSISSEFKILVSSGRINIQTTLKEQIKVGEPVKWIQNISLENPENITIQLPETAENISVIAIEETSGVPITITSNVIRSSNSKFSLFDFLFRFFSRLTGRVVEETPSETIEVVLEENSTEYIIEYETPAPEAFETETSFGKEVVISGPDNLNYTDVLSFTNISEFIEVGHESTIRILWKENNSYLPFDAYDLNDNNLLDYVEWITPHLSNQTFSIILISEAEHLDSNRTFIENVYDLVKTRDDNFSLINNGEYLRVSFEVPLTSTKDITIYAKSNGTSSVEVYERDGTTVLATFENISESKLYKIYLTNLTGSSEVFDLKVIGSVEFDYVTDPAACPDGDQDWEVNNINGYNITSDVSCNTITFRNSSVVNVVGANVISANTLLITEYTTVVVNNSVTFAVSDFDVYNNSQINAASGHLKEIVHFNVSSTINIWLSSSINTNVNITTDSLYLENLSEIDATGKGYSSYEGSGSMDNSSGSFGGSHGGIGNSQIQSSVYDSSLWPSDFGSGGGLQRFGVPQYTGGVYYQAFSGGGIVFIQANSTTIDGDISSGPNCDGFEGWSCGSGGSIRINTTSYSGAGRLFATGSNGYNFDGAGGRIAVHHDGTGPSFDAIKSWYVSADDSAFSWGTIVVVDRSNGNVILRDFRFQNASGNASELMNTSFYNSSDSNVWKNISTLYILSSNYVVLNNLSFTINATTINISNMKLFTKAATGDKVKFIYNNFYDDNSTYDSGIYYELEKEGIANVNFLQTSSASFSNLSGNFNLSNNFAFLNSSIATGLNRSANITFYNMPANFFHAAILRDGKYCSKCKNFTDFNDTTVIFNVTGWSNYTIGNVPELNVTVTAPTSIVHRVFQNDTFYFNATIQCLFMDCGDVNITLDPAFCHSNVFQDCSDYTNATECDATSGCNSMGEIPGECAAMTTCMSIFNQDSCNADSYCYLTGGDEVCINCAWSDMCSTWNGDEPNCLGFGCSYSAGICSGMGMCGDGDSCVYKGGIVSNVTGAIPFFTNTSNPSITNLALGQSINYSWAVNASGPLNTYDFFVEAYPLSDYGLLENSSHFNITIRAPLIISDCMVINESGGYRLNQSLMDKTVPVCIHIKASDVSVDCNENTIDATGSIHYSTAFKIEKASNVTISNCNISDWGYALQNYYSSETTFKDSEINSAGSFMPIYSYYTHNSVYDHLSLIFNSYWAYSNYFLYVINSNNNVFSNIDYKRNSGYGTTYFYDPLHVAHSYNNTFDNLNLSDSVMEYVIFDYYTGNNTIKNSIFPKFVDGRYFWSGRGNTFYNNVFNTWQDFTYAHYFYSYYYYYYYYFGYIPKIADVLDLYGFSGGTNRYNTSYSGATNILGYSGYGGNYWNSSYGRGGGFSNYCLDLNNDNVCDNQNLVDGYNGWDYYPLTFPDSTPPAVTIRSPSNNSQLYGGYYSCNKYGCPKYVPTTSWNDIYFNASDNKFLYNFSLSYKNSTSTSWTTICNFSDWYLSSAYSSCQFITHNLSSGSYTLRAGVSDTHGNYGYTTYNYYINRTLPEVYSSSVVYPRGQSAAKNGDIINFTLRAISRSSEMSGVQINLTEINGSALTSMTYSSGTLYYGYINTWILGVNVSSSTGFKFPAYFLTNAEGKISNSRTQAVVIDNEVPTYETLNNVTVLNNSFINLLLIASDNLNLRGYIFSTNISGSWVNDTRKNTWSGLKAVVYRNVRATTPGNFSYKFYIFDGAENMVQTSSGSIEVLGYPLNFTVYMENITDRQDITTSSFNFIYWYKNGIAKNCSLYLDGVVNATTFNATADTTYSITRSLTDGDHSVHTECFENETNSTYLSEVYTLSVDTAFPIVNITYPQNTTYISNITELDFFVNDSNLDKCWYSVNNGLTNSSEGGYFNYTDLGSVEGANTWRVYCRDYAGNENSSTVTFTSSIPPVVRISDPIYGSALSTGVALRYSVEEEHLGSCWYSNDTYSINLTLASCANLTSVNWSEGPHNVSIWANDSYGNEGVEFVNFLVDLTPPNGTILNPGNASFSNNLTQNFTIVVEDNYGVTNATLNVYNETGLFNRTTLTLSDATYAVVGVLLYLVNGVYNWFWEIFDLASNSYDTSTSAGSTGNYTTTIDTISPVVSISYPVTGQTYSSLSVINYTFIETNPQSCWYSNSSGVWNSSTVSAGTNFSSVITKEGSNTFVVYCSDDAQNEGYSTVTFTIVSTTTCTDSDSDGFNASATGCGTVDCNDGDSGINPNEVEVCGNQIDEDCSGEDESCVIEIYDPPIDGGGGGGGGILPIWPVDFCEESCILGNNIGKCISETEYILTPCYLNTTEGYANEPQQFDERMYFIRRQPSHPWAQPICYSYGAVTRHKCTNNTQCVVNAASGVGTTTSDPFGGSALLTEDASGNTLLASVPSCGVCDSPKYLCGDFGECLKNGTKVKACKILSDSCNPSNTTIKYEIEACIPATTIYFYPEQTEVIAEKDQPTYSEFGVVLDTGLSSENFIVEFLINGKVQKNSFYTGSFESNFNSNIYFGDKIEIKVKSNSYSDSRTWTTFSPPCITTKLGCIEECIPEWNCDWTVCEEGDSNSYAYNCVDLNFCNKGPLDIPVKQECSCYSNIQCSEWSECSSKYSYLDVVTDLSVVTGVEQRTCSDLNKCRASYSESKECTLSEPISTERVNYCGNEYLRIVDPITKELISSIKITDPSKTKFTNLDLLLYSEDYFLKQCPSDEVSVSKGAGLTGDAIVTPFQALFKKADDALGGVARRWPMTEIVGLNPEGYPNFFNWLPIVVFVSWTIVLLLVLKLLLRFSKVFGISLVEKSKFGDEFEKAQEQAILSSLKAILIFLKNLFFAIVKFSFKLVYLIPLEILRKIGSVLSKIFTRKSKIEVEHKKEHPKLVEQRRIEEEYKKAKSTPDNSIWKSREKFFEDLEEDKRKFFRDLKKRY